MENIKYSARLKVESLNIDERVQRDLSKSKVDRILKNFDERAIGFLLISQRDNDFYVIDGQHRLMALKKMGIKYVDCKVYTGLSVEEEGNLFLQCNNTRNTPSAGQNFKVKVNSGDEDAIKIKKIIEFYGLKINYKGGKREGVRAIAECEKIYRMYGAEMLSETISTIIKIWDKEYVDSLNLKGMPKFLDMFGDKIDKERFIKKMGELTKEKLRREVLGVMELTNKGHAISYCKVALDRYNKNLKKNHLQWPDVK